MTHVSAVFKMPSVQSLNWMIRDRAFRNDVTSRYANASLSKKLGNCFPLRAASAARAWMSCACFSQSASLGLN